MASNRTEVDAFPWRCRNMDTWHISAIVGSVIKDSSKQETPVKLSLYQSMATWHISGTVGNVTLVS
jgi:hypothetical protein